jgi:hypothetical protein
VLNTLSLYHENILIRGKILNPKLSGDNRFNFFQKVSTLLRILQNFEIIIEMYITKHYSDKVGVTLLGIESLK